MIAHKQTLFIARLAMLIAFTMVIQIAGLPQPITGPIINAMLFFTTMWLGLSAGIVLGCITPCVALFRGQLPAVLAPMLPFIAISNSMLMIVYYYFSKKVSILVAVIIASLIKFIFLALSVRVILPVVFAHTIPDNFAIAMTFPQFLTAIGGGIIAILLSRFLDRTGVH